MEKKKYGYEELDKETMNNAILAMLIHLRIKMGPVKGLGDMYDPQNPVIERDITWSSPSVEI